MKDLSSLNKTMKIFGLIEILILFSGIVQAGDCSTPSNYEIERLITPEGKVFVHTSDNKIICLDKNNEKVIWSYKIDGVMWFPPTITNGKIFVSSPDGGIYCLDENNGKLIWNYKPGAFVSSLPAVADGKVFISSSDGEVYCLNENIGEIIWSCKNGKDVPVSLAAVDEKAFIALVGAQSSINSAKKIGAGTTEAGKLLQQAKTALEEGKSEDAKNYARQAVESAEKARNTRLTQYGVVISLTLVSVSFTGIKIRRRKYEQRLNEYRAKLEQWDREGYVISEFKERWFK